MKKRKLLTDIFTIILMAAILLVVLTYIPGVFPGEDNTVKGSLRYTLQTYIGLPVALLCVALIDIVFPAIDNRERFRNGGFTVKFILKVLLFVGALVFGFLKFIAGKFEGMNDFVAVAIFCGLYFIQFCINLDPKPQKEEETDDEHYENDYNFEDSDDEE